MKKEVIKIGQYKRSLKRGKFWYYSGQYKGFKYHSKAIYLTKSECSKAERERLVELEREIKTPGEDITLFEVCTKRLDYLETKSKNYFVDNQRLFRKIIKAWGADTDIRRITRPMIHDFLLSESKRSRRNGYDNYTVNAEIRHLKALFSFAMDELECIDRNPTRKLKFYPVNKKLKYIPPDNHINMVCECLHPHQLRLYMFCILTACRISEALRATGNDIDTENNLLTLWTRKKKFGDLSLRRIELPPEVAEMTQEGRLFPEWSQYPRFIEKTCKEIGIKRFGWHAFRHRKASIMAKQGVPVNQIQHYLGHESLLVTQQYLHLLGFMGY